MKTVLVVDDDPACLLLLKMLMEKSGYTTDTAPDGQSALKLTEANDYDVVLMDLMMPGINGIDLARYIRASYPQVPPYLALITAFDLEHYRMQARKYGVNEFISKASGIKGFQQQIKELMERALESIRASGREQISPQQIDSSQV